MKSVLGLVVLAVLAVAVYSESCRNLWDCSGRFGHAHYACDDNYHKACVSNTCTCSPPRNSTHSRQCSTHADCPDNVCPGSHVGVHLTNFCFDDGHHSGQKTCHCALGGGS